MSEQSNTITLSAAPDEVKAYSMDRPFTPYTSTALQCERLAKFEGERIRVHIEGRKMSVPGRMAIVDGTPTLCTNWGLELDLSTEVVTRVDTKNFDNGRWEQAFPTVQVEDEVELAQAA